MKKIKMMMLAFLASASTVFANPTVDINDVEPVDAGTLINAFISKGVDILQPLGAAFIFLTVLLVGFDVIKNKGDAGKRTGAMSSLLWVAVGAIIMGSALFITGFLWQGTQVETSETNIITNTTGTYINTSSNSTNTTPNTNSNVDTGDMPAPTAN